MKITIISNNFFPEDTGIGLYSGQMADYLTRRHQVQVVTAVPYYPRWEIDPAYRERGRYLKETHNGSQVFRFKQYTPSDPTFAKRILQMVHYFGGSIRNLFKLDKPDLVIAVIPFTLNAVLGAALKMRFGSKLVVHVQDFEFDAAFETGLSSNRSGLSARAVFSGERGIFNWADLVSTISQSMMRKLAQKTKRPGFLFPNWIDPSKIDPASAQPVPMLPKDKFNLLYSGNIGAKQDWAFFRDFASALSNDPGIHLTLVGDGAKCKEVRASIAHLPNVSYFPPVAYSQLNDLLCGADLHLLFQKNTVVDTVMPSKLLGMMASGVPSLVTGHADSEVRSNFEQADYGYYFEAHQLEAVVQSVRELKSNPGSAREMGMRGRAFVTSHFAYEAVMAQFESRLEELVSGR